MNPQTILHIIELALELAIRIHDDMPQSQRVAFWERHEKFVKLIEGLLRQLEPQPAKP